MRLPENAICIIIGLDQSSSWNQGPRRHLIQILSEWDFQDYTDMT